MLVWQAADDIIEYVDESNTDIHAGLEGLHQVSLSLVRLSATQDSYWELPSSDQKIFTLLFCTLGAKSFSTRSGSDSGQ